MDTQPQPHTDDAGKDDQEESPAAQEGAPKKSTGQQDTPEPTQTEKPQPAQQAPQPTQQPSASSLPVVRTFHHDASAAKGDAKVNNFKPTRPQQKKKGQVKDKTLPTEDTSTPQVQSGFVPPTQLHRTGSVSTPQRAPKQPEQPKQQQTPPQSALEKKPQKSIVRTYEDDSAEELEKKKGSVASIAMAERKRGEKQPARGISWKKIAIRAVTVVLIIGGLGIAGFAFYKAQTDTQPQVDTQTPSIVRPENVQEVHVADSDPTEIRNVIDSFLSSDTPANELHELKLYTYTQTQDGEQEQSYLDAREFFDRIGLERRSPLARALGGDIMIARYGLSSPQPVFIADVAAYSNAFAALIRWERDILEDLNFFLPPVIPPLSATSTATSTSEAPEFRDVIIDNRDVRLIHDEFGKTRLLYSFPTPQILVITTDTEVFRAVLERLGQQ